MKEVQKAAVSVSEMARMCGLSRARFYQLISDNVMAKPSYDPDTKRPYYCEEGQAQCLEVKRRNVGVNGKVVIFYASRSAQPKRSPKAKSKPTNQHNDLMESLACLGMSATAQQVEAAVTECFPDGIQNLESGEVVRVVFLHLKRQESSR
jgi:hypothetical protein